MSGGNPVVAVVDDESKMRSALARLLRTHGFDTELFETGEEFLSSVRARVPDCVLLDLHMPGITGFEVLETLTSSLIAVPAVVITGYDEPGNAERVRSLGAAEYLVKPVDETVLVGAIDRARARPAPGSATIR
jgi:FixJ family two-component response regulator